MTATTDRKWNGKSRGGTLGNWFFVVTLKYFGVNAAYILLAFVAPYFVFFAPKATRASWKYFRYVHQRSVVRSALSIFVHFYRFGQTIIDKIALKHGIMKPYGFDYGNYTEFLDVLDSGKGAVIIGAHVGSWEVGAPFFREYGKNINIVMLDAEYERIKHVIESHAECRDYKIIPLSEDGLESILKVKCALDKKEYVCFQGDRFMDAGNAIETTFMGRKAYFPKGVFQLAARLRVPVVFYFAMRNNSRHYNFMFHIANTTDRAEGQKPEEALLKQYVAHLEAVVKQYPYQWFNFYNFWSEY